MGTNPSNDDYYAGKFAGENAAKQDALDIQGNIGQTSMMFTIKRNIARHLKQMEGPLSKAYIKGFKWGYKRAFVSYNDTYNGGG